MTPTATLVPVDRSAQSGTPAVTPDQLELIRTTIAKGATDVEPGTVVHEATQPSEALATRFAHRAAQPVTALRHVPPIDVHDVPDRQPHAFVWQPDEQHFSAGMSMLRQVGV